MKIDIDQHNNLRLKEVFSGILLETEEGNQIGVCMRDDTFEINVLPKDRTGHWHRVDMQRSKIVSMANNHMEPTGESPAKPESNL